MFLSENLQDKWEPILEHSDLPKIEDNYKKGVTAVILENQENALREDRNVLSEAAPLNSTGDAISNWDPILISLVRRAMPNLVAYDICGVQPMTPNRVNLRYEGKISRLSIRIKTCKLRSIIQRSKNCFLSRR